MIDQTAFFSLSYGLYVIASKDGERRAGCIANTFQQVTSSPLQVSVALNKDNATTSVVRTSGRFTATCLSQEATMELVGTFGFHSSADRDKFAACPASVDAEGHPYVSELACSRFSARVVQEVDLGSHVLFVGEVEEAENLDAGEPMTYAYYHLVKGGKTPPKASSFLPDLAAVPAGAAPTTGTPTTGTPTTGTPTTGTPATGAPEADTPAGDALASGVSAAGAAVADVPAGVELAGASDAGVPGVDAPTTGTPQPKYAWRCTVCGHLEYVDELPDDYMCPVCGVGKDMFERVEL